jgi:protein TonB
MFEQALLTTPQDGHRGWSTFAGVAAQSILVTAAVLAPIVFPGALPKLQSIVSISAPPGISKPVAERPVSRSQPHLTPVSDPKVWIPTSIPQKPAMITDEPAGIGDPPSGPGVPGGIGRGDLPIGLAQVAVPPPPPPPQPTHTPKPVDTAPQQIKVSRGVQEALILHKPLPLYPPLARAARISGVVQLTGIIGTDGRIRSLHVDSGHPLLVKAAVDAVKQWVYRPTLLNGEAVEVIAPITVNFTLN